MLGHLQLQCWPSLVLVYLRDSPVKGWHDDVIKWKHFPRYWPFVRKIHRSLLNSTHKGQWRGALMFSIICAWTNGWVNNLEAGDSRHHRAHYDVTVMDTRSYKTFRPLTPNVMFFKLPRTIFLPSLSWQHISHGAHQSSLIGDWKFVFHTNKNELWHEIAYNFCKVVIFYSETQALAIQVMSYKVYMLWIFSVIGLRFPTLVNVFHHTCISKPSWASPFRACPLNQQHIAFELNL